MVIYRQIRYKFNRDVGFNKEQILVIARAEVLGTRINAFKESVKGIPGVIKLPVQLPCPDVKMKSPDI